MIPGYFPYRKMYGLQYTNLLHSFKKTVGQLEFETVGPHVADLASRYPEARLIMAHLDGNAYHGIKCIKEYKNVGWIFQAQYTGG